MLGSSRWSLEAASEALVERSRAAGASSDFSVWAEVGTELSAVADLLGDNLDLRRILSDGGTADDRRSSIVRSLFEGKVRAETLATLDDVVRRRWSQPHDLAEAVETLGAQAEFLAAEQAGTLDTVEDELYRVSRIARGSAELRTALSDRWLPAEQKVALVRDLFGGKVDPLTERLIEQVVGSPRSRRVEDALEGLAQLASRRHGQVLAEVHVAQPLTTDQASRLTLALSGVYGRPVRITEVIDADVVGGVKVVVGDEVIDGSVARKLAQARQQLAG